MNFFVFICLSAFSIGLATDNYQFLPSCPGITKPMYITPEAANEGMYVVLQINEPADDRQIAYTHRRRFTFARAAQGIGTDPEVDFQRRRTMVFMDGYMDSAHQMTVRFLTGDFAALGYNTIAVDAQRMFSFSFPVAARVSYQVANYTAMLMRDLMKFGLNPKDVDLVGISLGGQTVSLVAKTFTKLTGQKVARIFSMDPGGPCFRGYSPKYHLTASDADLVQVVHTGNDGYGMGDAMGHVDFYMNGGEWQFILNPYQPSEDLLSHIISSIYLYSSLLLYPEKFVGIKCKNVQQAREHKCYENYPYETNTLGFKVDPKKPGIYYIPVTAFPPLYAPKDWMEKKPNYPLIYNEAMNDVEHFVLKERSLDLNLASPQYVNTKIDRKPRKPRMI